jgi:pSer/pThr/pTyr-binding forkhead associated (FHA) protein
MIAKLLVVEGSATQREVTLRRPRTVAGRKKGCKLRIRSDLVSRIHCSLICDDDGLRVKDLGSSNGTFVNGLRITEAVLNAGDVVQIGPVKFVVQLISSQTAGSQPAGVPATTMKLPDGEVVVFQSEDDLKNDAEQIIEADVTDELDDAAFETRGEGHPPVDRRQNIFASESKAALDAGEFLIEDGESAGRGYDGADERRDSQPRR